MNKNIAVAIAFACCSCATVYKADEGAPAARVRFISYSPQQTLVAALSDEQCSITGKAGRIAVLAGPISVRSKSLGMIGGENVNLQYMHEAEVPAGKPFIYVFKTSNFKEFRCVSSVSFVPQASQQYETTFIVEEGTCKTTLSLLTQKNGEVQRVKQEPHKVTCDYPGSF